MTDDDIQQVLDRGTVGSGPVYRIEECLGHGGMGAVFKAYEKSIDDPVALKVEFLSDDPDEPDFRSPETKEEDRENAVERFQREVMLASRLSKRNPAIVRASHFQIERGPDGKPVRLLYEMEQCLMMREDALGVCRAWRVYPRPAWSGNWPRSVTLRNVIREANASGAGCLPQDAVARIALTLVGALRTVHDRGVVHFDVKPENVLVCKGGRLKLADFGLAKLASWAAAESTTGGTRGYMAPEQYWPAARKVKAGPPADYYALGVVLNELLTGRRMAWNTTDDEWRNPSDSGDSFHPVCRNWDVLLKGMMEKDPRRRLADPDLLLFEFGEIAKGRC